MNAPVTQVTKEMVLNAQPLIIAILDSTTVMPMPHAVPMDPTSAAHVILDSAVMVPVALTTMNVPTELLSATLTRLVTTMLADIPVHVMVDMKVTANNVPTSTNAQIVAHVTPMLHVLTLMVVSPVHVTLDIVVTATHVLISTNVMVLITAMQTPPAQISQAHTLVLVTMVSVVMETHALMSTSVPLDPTTAQTTPAVLTKLAALNPLATMVILETASIASQTNAVITILAMHMLITHKTLEALNAHIDKDTQVTDIRVTMSTSVTRPTHVMPMLLVIKTLVDTAVNVRLI